METQFPGMDYDFLRYMGVFPENQRRIQSHYTPYFERCQRVVDLACGDADFVGMLVERGIEVIGVDSDDKAFAAAASKGLPVVQADVFDWLAAQPDNSFDGVFSAHLIEHLPYPKVVELIEQSYRILQPGGVILLVTPNARSLFSHLEMFYTHFGHVTFYHPRLVSFFLDRAGFVNLHTDENPITASPLLPDLRRLLQEPMPPAIAGQNASSSAEVTLPNWVWPTESPTPLPSLPPAEKADEFDQKVQILYRNEVPLQGRTPFHYLSYWAKKLLTGWLVRPLTDSLAESLAENAQAQACSAQAQVSRMQEEMAANNRRLAELFRQMLEQQQALAEARQQMVGERIDLLCQSLQQLHGLLQQEQTIRHDQVSHLESAEREIHQQLRAFAADIQRLNGPFEAFIWAYKPVEVNEVEVNEINLETNEEQP